MDIGERQFIKWLFRRVHNIRFRYDDGYIVRVVNWRTAIIEDGNRRKMSPWFFWERWIHQYQINKKFRSQIKRLKKEK